MMGRFHWIRWKREIVGRAARISLSSWEVNESEMAGTRTNEAVTSQWWGWWAWTPRGVWAPWPGPPSWCWWPSWWPPPAPTCPPTATSTPCAPASCKPPLQAQGYSTPLSPPRLLTPSSPWCRLLLISGTSAVSGSLLPEFQVTLLFSPSQGMCVTCQGQVSWDIKDNCFLGLLILRAVHLHLKGSLLLPPAIAFSLN